MKHFTQEGGRYTLKPQTAFNSIVIGLIVLAGIAAVIYLTKPGFGYFLLGFAAFAWYSSYVRKLVIDTDRSGYC